MWLDVFIMPLHLLDILMVYIKRQLCHNNSCLNLRLEEEEENEGSRKIMRGKWACNAQVPLTKSSSLGSTGVWVWSPASVHPCTWSLALFWCICTCRLKTNTDTHTSSITQKHDELLVFLKIMETELYDRLLNFASKTSPAMKLTQTRTW